MPSTSTQLDSLLVPSVHHRLDDAHYQTGVQPDGTPEGLLHVF